MRLLFACSRQRYSPPRSWYTVILATAEPSLDPRAGPFRRGAFFRRARTVNRCHPRRNWKSVNPHLAHIKSGLTPRACPAIVAHVPPKKKRTEAREPAFGGRVARAFGTQLQAVRKKHGMKQDAFADAMGVSRTTVSNIECGRQRVFLDQVVRAAEVLEVSLLDLLPAADYAPKRTLVLTATDARIPDSTAIALSKTVAEVAQEITTSGSRRRRAPERS